MGHDPDPEYMLYMGANATTVGMGDVSGYVNRSSFTMGTDYTFGNQYTLMNFTAGTLPTSVTLEIYLVSSQPSWMVSTTPSVYRYYDVMQTGSDTTTRLRFKAHYLNSELHGATEGNLDLFDYHVLTTTVLDHGHSDFDTVNNWVSFANVGLVFLGGPSADVHFLTLGTRIAGDTCIWIGGSPSGVSDWDLPDNWQGGVPDSLNCVKIPGGLTYYPLLPNGTRYIACLRIYNGAVVNATTGTPSLYINGSDNPTWLNTGTFNAGASSIVFNNRSQLNTATLFGTTNFYNLSITANSSLQAQTGSITRIAGTLSQGISSDLDFTTFENVVEYNGTNQNVINPTGSNPGFNTFIVSGSGTKTFPAGNLQIVGDFINNGTVDANGGTVHFDEDPSLDPCEIAGTTPTTFYNLDINTTYGTYLSGSVDATVSNNLTFTNGRLITNGNKVILGSSCAAATVSGAGTTSYIDGNLRVYVPNASSPTVALPIGDDTSYTPASIAFTGSTSGCGYLDAFTTVEAPPTGALPTGAFLNYAKYVKRSWTINNTGVTFSSPYSASFTFAPSDIQGGGDPTKFVVRKYDASNWYKTTNGTRTSTSTQCIGSNSFSKFVIGEANDTKGMPLYMFR